MAILSTGFHVAEAQKRGPLFPLNVLQRGNYL